MNIDATSLCKNLTEISQVKEEFKMVNQKLAKLESDVIGVIISLIIDRKFSAKIYLNTNTAKTKSKLTNSQNSSLLDKEVAEPTKIIVDPLNEKQLEESNKI